MVKVVLSCELFGGFEVFIDPLTCRNMRHFVHRVVEVLRHTLRDHHFRELEARLDARRYHFHSISWAQLHDTNANETVYLCSHIQ